MFFAAETAEKLPTNYIRLRLTINRKFHAKHMSGGSPAFATIPNPFDFAQGSAALEAVTDLNPVKYSPPSIKRFDFTAG